MFHDLDASLATLLRMQLPPEIVDQVTVTFATPNGQFPPASVALPAVGLFLCSIQENTDLRQATMLTEHTPEGRVIQRRA